MFGMAIKTFGARIGNSGRDAAISFYSLNSI